MMPDMPAFAELATAPDPPLDELALALAAEFRAVDAAAALGRLDALGADLAAFSARGARTAEEQVRACADLLGGVEGFAGDREHYDDPGNSMLDLVLERRRGLPILLSVVYVEVGRRAGLPLGGVGLPGHFVVGHFGPAPRPLLIDPFAGGAPVHGEPDPGLVRPWRAHEIALRMLNNLVGSFQRRADVGAAIHAAQMRLRLPVDEELGRTLLAELRAMQARLN